MKRQLFLITIAVGMFIIPLTSINKQADNKIVENRLKFRQDEPIGSAVAPNGDRYDLYGTYADITAAYNEVTLQGGSATGHTYQHGVGTWVVCITWDGQHIDNQFAGPI